MIVDIQKIVSSININELENEHQLFLKLHPYYQKIYSKCKADKVKFESVLNDIKEELLQQNKTKINIPNVMKNITVLKTNKIILKYDIIKTVNIKRVVKLAINGIVDKEVAEQLRNLYDKRDTTSSYNAKIKKFAESFQKTKSIDFKSILHHELKSANNLHTDSFIELSIKINNIIFELYDDYIHELLDDEKNSTLKKSQIRLVKRKYMKATMEYIDSLEQELNNYNR